MVASPDSNQPQRQKLALILPATVRVGLDKEEGSVTHGKEMFESHQVITKSGDRSSHAKHHHQSHKVDIISPVSQIRKLGLKELSNLTKLI